MTNEFVLLEILDTPVFWIDQYGLIQWFNRAVKESFIPIQESTNWMDTVNQLPQGYIYHFHEYVLLEQPGVLVECVPDTEPEILAQLNRVKAANDELELIFNASFDEVFVTDGEGVTLRVNEAARRLYGLTSQEFIGRSVQDLENERIFYPSATSMVLRGKKQVTILQWTKAGRQLVVTANPVFDDQGNIIRIISNAKDVTDMPLPYDRRSFFPTLDSDMSMSRPAEAETNGWMTSSPVMQSTINLIQKVAPTDVTVLLLGETGVGKNRMAHLLHRLSRRSERPFVEINCAAIPETLLESELFGYERGAFTGANREGKLGKVELAKGGTLFLNEVTELPLHLQGKLLDLLQERTISRVGGTQTYKVDLRIVAATNKDLERLVETGQFREDLYYRLHVVPIAIPPLRLRKEDIEVLANQWLQQCAREHGRSRKILHPTAVQVLTEYSWPGNVRELQNTLEGLAVTLDDDVIRAEHFPSKIWKSSESSEPIKSLHIPSSEEPITPHPFLLPRSPSSVSELLSRVEKALYAQALERYKTTYAVAKNLQVSQPTVVRKLKQYGLAKSH